MTSSLYYTYICIYYIFHIRQLCGVFLPTVIAQKYTHVCHITICTVWRIISRTAHTAYAQTSRSIAHAINAAAISGTLGTMQQPIKKERNSAISMQAVLQQLTHIYLYIYSVHKQRQRSTHTALYVNIFVERLNESQQNGGVSIGGS